MRPREVSHDRQMVVTAEEDHLIGQVVDRLLTQFPQVPQATVQETVGSILDRFDDAPIRDFVPLFVETAHQGELADLAGADGASRACPAAQPG